MGSETMTYEPEMMARLRSIVEETSRVNDDWFRSGAFKTWKNPMPVKYEIADAAGTVDTLEGPVRYDAGHYIITGPKGERYPITAEKFASLYDDNGNGTATPKRVEKWAKVADHDGVLHTSWGDLAYTTGADYIVRHGPGDYGAVKADIFAKTYHQPGGPQDTLAEDTATGHWALLNDILDEEDFLADEMEEYLDAIIDGQYADAVDFLNEYLSQSEAEGAWFGNLRALEIKPNPADEDEPFVLFNKAPRGMRKDAMIKTILTDIKRGNMGLAASRYLLMRENGESGPELDTIGKSLAASKLLGESASMVEAQGISQEQLLDAMRKFLIIAKEEIGLDQLPKIYWSWDDKIAPDSPSFGRFTNDDKAIKIIMRNRHPIDIMRTLAHELVHYQQDLQHKIGPRSGETGSPIENEANALAGQIMRRFDQENPELFALAAVTP
jgi:PGDYG protein